MKWDSQAESFTPLKKSLIPLPLGNFGSGKLKYFMYDIFFLENYLHKSLHPFRLCKQRIDTKAQWGNLGLTLTINLAPW